MGALLLGMVLWGLWQSSVRFSRVAVSGGDSAMAVTAQRAMRGTYFHLIPRNSVFFYPAGSVRRALMSSDPSIAAISLRRSGGATLRVTVTDRVALARWCGADSTPTFQQCYVFDPSGFLFATTSPLIRQAASVASSTATSSLPMQVAAVAMAPVSSVAGKPLDSYVVYEPLATSTAGPIGATLPNAAAFPEVFSFAQQLTPFGSEVRTIAIKNGEVDDTLASGTVVKYLLADASRALSALTAARQDINLADGSIEYVDLRFNGKVYVKKKANAALQGG